VRCDVFGVVFGAPWWTFYWPGPASANTCGSHFGEFWGLMCLVSVLVALACLTATIVAFLVQFGFLLEHYNFLIVGWLIWWFSKFFVYF